MNAGGNTSSDEDEEYDFMITRKEKIKKKPIDDDSIGDL